MGSAQQRHYAIVRDALVGASDTFRTARTPSSHLTLIFLSSFASPRWASRHKLAATDATIFDRATMADEGLVYLPSAAGLDWLLFPARRSGPCVRHGQHHLPTPLDFPSSLVYSSFSSSIQHRPGCFDQCTGRPTD